MRTVNIVLVLVSLNFFVNLRFEKFKFVQLIADGPDQVQTTVNTTIDQFCMKNTKGGVKFSEMTGFQCIYNCFFAICFSLIKNVSHLSSMAGTEPSTVDHLSSFAVIKENVVQTQMVLHFGGLYKSSDFLIITRI